MGVLSGLGWQVRHTGHPQWLRVSRQVAVRSEEQAGEGLKLLSELACRQEQVEAQSFP